MSATYNQRLAKLRMPRASARGSALVSAIRVRKRWPKWLTVEETATLIRALHHGASHVFFRRFVDSDRASIPQAYVFDNTNSALSSKALTELQWKMWNSHEVPLCFIFQPDTVDILGCWTKPDFFDEGTGQCHYTPNEVITLASNAQAELDKLARFSGDALENGSFWDNPRNGHLTDTKRSAHGSLITAIVELDEELASKRILPETLRRKVLVICLMLKYLEDRGVLDASDFKRFRTGATELFQVLESAKSFVALLAAQARRFNGDVFQLSSDERQLLLDRDKDLGRFAHILDGRTSQRQAHLWKLYSFEHLPVEIISYIYQRFVKGAVGAVYTPPFLVDFLLGEAMPYANITDAFTVLDPSCGSGVFLVGAFKRLVNHWMAGRKWQCPPESLLKRRLKELVQQVHGVDDDPFAVELTVFSLCLALCDRLEPKQIRRHFEFDNLRGVTICKGDFFEFLPKAEQAKSTWDLIIGNPPFETSQFTPAAIVIEQKAKTERAETAGAVDTPYQQLAFLFLEQSLRIVASNGTACLLVPSTFLYGINSAAFRASILRRWHVPQIIDFTSIRSLFPGGDTKCCAVFVLNRPPIPSTPLLHITPRRTTATKEGLFFEIDAYDFHRIHFEAAIADDSVWKANLLGGGRIHTMLRRLLTTENTLGNFVRERKSKGWLFQVGFIKGKTYARQEAAHITGMPHLPTDAFTDNGIDESRIRPLILSSDDIRSPETFLRKLKDGKDALSSFLWAHFPAPIREGLSSDMNGPKLSARSQRLLATQLNELIAGPSLFNEERFASVRLSDETKTLAAAVRRGSSAVLLNHRLLADAYPHQIVRTPLFDAPRSREQFEPPSILIRLLDTLPMSLRADYVTYRDDVVGIKAPANEFGELNTLLKDLRRLKDIHRFFLYTTAPQLFVGKATVPQKFDLDRLPLITVAEITEPLFSEADNAIIKDVVNYFGDFVRLGQDSVLFRGEAGADELKAFSNQYLNLLNAIYGKFQVGSVVRTDAFTCAHFSYGGPPKAELSANRPLEEALQILLHRHGEGVRVQRVLRLYAWNTIYLIKPNRLRYWIPSVAVRDADETVAELAAQTTFPALPHQGKR